MVVPSPVAARLAEDLRRPPWGNLLTFVGPFVMFGVFLGYLRATGRQVPDVAFVLLAASGVAAGLLVWGLSVLDGRAILRFVEGLGPRVVEARFDGDEGLVAALDNHVVLSVSNKPFRKAADVFLLFEMYFEPDGRVLTAAVEDVLFWRRRFAGLRPIPAFKEAVLSSGVRTRMDEVCDRLGARGGSVGLLEKEVGARASPGRKVMIVLQSLLLEGWSGKAAEVAAEIDEVGTLLEGLMRQYLGGSPRDQSPWR